MEKQIIINRALARLGHPIVKVELDEEIIDSLFDEAFSTFSYYYKLSMTKEDSVFKDISNLSMNSIESSWVTRYLTALIKEATGNISAKFSGEVDIPGRIFKIDYSHLLRESESEKVALIKDIYPQYEYELSPFVLLVVYVKISNLDSEDARNLLSKVTANLKEKLPDFVNIIVMSTQSETKVEVLYSNNSKKEIDLDLHEQLRDLDKDLEKYIKNEE